MVVISKPGVDGVDQRVDALLGGPRPLEDGRGGVAVPRVEGVGGADEHRLELLEKLGQAAPRAGQGV